MTDQCGFGLQYGDFVDFCCAELGKTIMVAMEVTDHSGNKNTCMVEVTVEDKLKPTITCPPDITLACTDSYDFAHLDIFGTVVSDSSKIKDILVHNHYHNGNHSPSPITNNLSLIAVHGHTDAMMLPVINYKGKTIVYMADLLPSVAHMPLPYVMGYDMFPLTTPHEKKTFLAEALSKEYILYFEHDPKNECCTLQQTEKGIRHKDAFALSEL